ncbi:MAG: hypothetical protein ACR2PC_14630 [Tsuneonella suprasediminis]
MNQRIFAPYGRFMPSARQPGETLYDYLVRCQWEMRGRIRLLEAVRDGQETIFFDERARWRRRMIFVASAEAGFATIAYVLFDWFEGSENMAPPMMAAMIGLCALLGAIASMGVIAMLEGPRTWTRAICDRFWRLADWLWPDDDDLAIQQLPAWVDANRPETIDAAVQERVAQYLGPEAFFWRMCWLGVQSAIVVIIYSAAQIARGIPLLWVIEDAVAVAMLCVIGGSLLVLIADLVSTNLGRVGRWWRRL